MDARSRGLVIAMRQLDWRVWFGLTLTFAWLALGAIYVETTVGWNRFSRLHVDEVGSFLEGAFAPLAFLWLVIGYFLQKKELENNTATLRGQLEGIQRYAEQAVIQSEKMAANEVHARQETFLKVAQNVRGQLGTVVGLLWISSQGGTGGTVSSEEQGRLFAQLSMNDPEVFSRRMLETHGATVGDQERYALFYGTEVRARHTNNFIYTFERLLQRARDVDQDGMITDALHTSGHGFVYRIAKRYQGLAPEDLNNPERTGRHIIF